MKRFSLSVQLMAGLVLLIALQATFIGVYYYRNTSDRYIESALNTTRAVLMSNVELIDAKLLRLESQANKLAVSDELYKLLLMMPDQDMGPYHWSKGYDWSREGVPNSVEFERRQRREGLIYLSYEDKKSGDQEGAVTHERIPEETGISQGEHRGIGHGIAYGTGERRAVGPVFAGWA